MADNESLDRVSISSLSRVPAARGPALLRVSLKVTPKPNANVEVSLLEGRNLPATQPYIKVYMSKEGKDMKETKQKTATHQTPNPLINYQFYYRLPTNLDDSYRVQISVWDESRIPHGCVGGLSFLLKDLCNTPADGWFKVLAEDDGRSRNVPHVEQVGELQARDRAPPPATGAALLKSKALGMFSSMARRREDRPRPTGEGTVGPDAVLTVGPIEVVSFGKPADDLGFTLVGSSESELGGLFVADVEAESAAARAGLAPGDRLMAIGARGVLWSTLKEALFELSTVAPGQQVTLVVVRGGPLALRALSEEITAAGRGDSDATRPRWGRGIELQGEAATGRIDSIGPLLQRDLKRDAAGSLGAFITGGCDTKLGAPFVVEPAADVDLQPGDRLLEINGLSCVRFAQAEVLDQLRLGGPVVRLVVQRLGARQWAAVQAAANVKANTSTLRPAGLASARTAAPSLVLSPTGTGLSATGSLSSVGSTPAPGTAAIGASTLAHSSVSAAGLASPGADAGPAGDGGHPAEYELLRERAVREQLQRSMFDLEQDAQARQAKLAALRRELADAHGILATTTQQLEQARRTVAQDQIALRAAQERDAAVSAQLTELAGKSKHLEDEKSAVLKSLARSERELDGLRATHESEGKQQRARIATLEADLKRVHAEADEERERRDRVHDEKMRDLKSTHEGALARLQSKLEELAGKHAAEMEELKEKHAEEIEQLNFQLKEKDEQHRADMQLAQEHITLAAQRKRDRAGTEDGQASGGEGEGDSSDEADEHIAEITRLRAELRDVRRELETTRERAATAATAPIPSVSDHHGPSHATSTAAHAHAHGSHHHLNVSGASGGTASSGEDSDGPTRAAWNDAADESESHSHTAKALEAQVAALQEQVDTLSAQVEQHVQTIAQLQEDVATQQQHVEDRSQEVERLTNHLAELQATVRAKEEECVGLREQMQEVFSEKEAAESARDELQAAVTQLEESTGTLQHQVAVATDRLNDYKDEHRALRGYADRLAQELINLKQFKALERASMPEADDDDEETGRWVASPKKGKR